jgi:poly-gamma-glutamate synthesis protein (capsule biosynthesis protein)
VTGSTRITLCLGGDVMTGRGIDQVLPHPLPPRLHEPVVTSALDYVALAERAHGSIRRPVSHSYVWGDALEEMERRRPAARIVNLETSITTSEDAEPKGINYRMHPDNVPVLGAARIDCCAIANNHVLDWGTAGLRQTLDALDRAGIRTAGAGRSLAEARRPAVLPVGGGARVLVFALATPDSGIPLAWGAGADTPGVHLLSSLSEEGVALVAGLVDAVKRRGDVALASVHWGGNWGYEIPVEQRRFAHALIDRAGIDVVHGHSSHHPKGIEVHGGRAILYGCGDLLDDYEGIPGRRRFRSDLALLYFPTLDARTGELTGLEMAPLRILNLRLQRPSSGDAGWLRAMLDRECASFGHRVISRGDAFALEWE